MKASRYNIFAPSANGFLGVNLLSRTAIDLSSDSLRVFHDLADGRLDLDGASSDPDIAEFMEALINGMFLVPTAFDELDYVRNRVATERFDESRLGLVIAPTMGCNFSCHYCFESHTDARLSEAACARVVEIVSDRLPGRENLSVQWFGGEPLLALDLIERLSGDFIRIARDCDAVYAATLITNGHALNRDVAIRMSQCGVVDAQITFDGDRPLHDRTRRERGGHGSFDQIIENIRSASDLLRFKLRVHVAPYNLESVFELLETLAVERLSEHIHELYFAPIFNYRSGMSTQAYAPDTRRFLTSEQFAQAQIDLIREAVDHGFRMTDPLDVSYGICTAVRADTLVVDPYGNLMKCYKDVGVATESFANTLNSVVQPRNERKWLDIDVPRDDECRDCSFLPVCLGGCTKQWQEGASKDVICTPLKFNHEARFRLYSHELEGHRSSVGRCRASPTPRGQLPNAALARLSIASNRT